MMRRCMFYHPYKESWDSGERKQYDKVYETVPQTVPRKAKSHIGVNTYFSCFFHSLYVL